MGEGAIVKHHVNKRISRSRRSARYRPKGARNDEPDEPTNEPKVGPIVLLALLGLVRPLLSITGVYDSLGGGYWAPVLVTILVAAVWVCVVLVTRAPNPLLTLVAAGGLYGAFAILL